MAAGSGIEKKETGYAISVIVPVYNGAEYLRQCADSILEQSYRNLELILVDDGSTDGAGQICDEYAERDSRVRVVHKQNEGLMMTWMCGVRNSTAPYLMFIDADDWIDLSCLEEMSAFLTGSNEIICSGYIIEREWNGTSEKKDNIAAPGVYEGEELRNRIKKNLLGNEERTLILSRCMKLFSRQLIENNLHFCDTTIRMGEDLNITVPAFLDADRVVVMKEAFYYHYRFVHQSMAHQFDAGMYANICRLRNVLRDICSEKGADPGMAEREFLYLFLLVLKIEIRNRASLKEVSARIRQLCAEAGAQEMIRRYRPEFASPANRLLGIIMKDPSYLRIGAVRLIFLLKG